MALGCPASSETRSLGENLRVAPTQLGALHTHGSKSAFRWSALKIQKLLWRLHLAVPQASSAEVPASSSLQLLFAAMGILLSEPVFS